MKIGSQKVNLTGLQGERGISGGCFDQGSEVKDVLIDAEFLQSNTGTKNKSLKEIWETSIHEDLAVQLVMSPLDQFLFETITGRTIIHIYIYIYM